MHIQKMLKASLAAMPLVGFTSTIPVEGTVATVDTLKAKLEEYYKLSGTKVTYTVGTDKLVVQDDGVEVTTYVAKVNGQDENRYSIEVTLVNKTDGTKVEADKWGNYTDEQKEKLEKDVLTTAWSTNEITAMSNWSITKSLHYTWTLAQDEANNVMAGQQSGESLEQRFANHYGAFSSGAARGYTLVGASMAMFAAFLAA